MKGYIDTKLKKRIKHRLSIIKGQIGGLQRMIENDEYCIDILYQSHAIQKSLKSLDAVMLENHFAIHISQGLASKQKAKITQEMIRLFRLNSR